MIWNVDSFLKMSRFFIRLFITNFSLLFSPSSLIRYKIIFAYRIEHLGFHRFAQNTWMLRLLVELCTIRFQWFIETLVRARFPRDCPWVDRVPFPRSRSYLLEQQPITWNGNKRCRECSSVYRYLAFWFHFSFPFLSSPFLSFPFLS